MPYQPIEGTTVLGIGHKARQGKDSMANFMQDRLGSRMLRLGFADALYAVARVEHGMTLKDPKLLQYLGTEVFRAKDPDVWIRTLYHTILDKRPKVVVIPDVRFPNEAEFVKQLGGKLVKVVRMNKDGSQFQDPARNPNHPSECSLNDYDGWDSVCLITDGHMDALKQAAETVLEQYGIQ